MWFHVRSTGGKSIFFLCLLRFWFLVPLLATYLSKMFTQPEHLLLSKQDTKIRYPFQTFLQSRAIAGRGRTGVHLPPPHRQNDSMRIDDEFGKRRRSSRGRFHLLRTHTLVNMFFIRKESMWWAPLFRPEWELSDTWPALPSNRKYTYGRRS